MRVVFFLFYLTLCNVALATNYYVSDSSGSDSNSGTSITQPWKTLSKVNSFTPNPGDQILFKRGDEWNETLTVKASGLSGSPIIYGVYDTGAKPIISGFTTITSGWTNEGGGIYSKVITSDIQTNMVTINGVEYGMGRYPNSSYLTYESYNSNISITDNQLSGTPNWTGAELIKRPNNFAWERCQITNHSGTTITYTNSLSSYTGTSGNGYFIQNSLQTLDQYGEWYHDTKTGKFYMYFGAVNPSTKTVKVATKNSLITNPGKQYVTISDLDVQGSIQNAVYVSTPSNNFTIQNCSVSFAGDYGIYVNSQNGVVDGNTIHDCNQGAIRGTSSLINITNNTISNIGLIVGSSKLFYSAILATSNNSGLVQYNNIDSVGYNGIFVKGENSIIQYNFINHTCLILNDGGGIYTAGSSGNAGMLIDHNIILNTYGNHDGGDTPISISEGIFLDEKANGITVSNNTCAFNGYSGIKLHESHTNKIEGNHCFDNVQTGIYLVNSSTSINTLFDDTIQNNQFVAKSGQRALMIREAYASSPSGIGNFDYNIYARPISDDQVIQTYYNSSWSYRTLSQWQAYSGQDANSHKSTQTITSDNDLKFVYNNAKQAKTYNSGSSTFTDIDGNTVSGSFTLLPFTSKILLGSGSISTSDPDTSAPIITSFSISSTSTTLTVPITSFTATDNILVVGYKLTETATAPNASDAGWLTSAPTSYTFSSEGTKTLYAWVKDSSGNVSSSKSNQVIISLSENTGNTNLGYTDIYSNTTVMSNRLAMPVTFNEAGDIQSITIYHNSGTGSMLLGVYSDASGSPSSQLGVTAAATVNATEGWQTVNLISPVGVSSGQTVWLAWVFQNSTGVRFVSGSPGRALSSATWSAGMPATFGASSIGNSMYSIYCTYIPVGTISNLGYTDVYSSRVVMSNRMAMPVTFNEAGDIQSITIYHNAGTGSMLLGVYSDASGSPSSQLGVTAAATVNATEGWQTVNLISPVGVSSGQTVWLAWVFQNSTEVRYVAGSPGRALSPATWSAGMPTTFGASSIVNAKYSIYCTYTTILTLKDATIVENEQSKPASSLSSKKNNKITTFPIVESSVNTLETNDFKLFPNPAKSSINIDYTFLHYMKTRIIIIDSNGRTILDQMVESNSNKIDISQFPAGIYYLKSINQLGNQTKKFIIAK